MRKTIKGIILTTLVGIMMLAGTTVAFGSDTALTKTTPQIKVQYDGKYIAFSEAAPKIIKGRTMVPFRKILEEMGMTVSFDTATKTVTAKNDSMEMSFKIGGTDILIKQGDTNVTKKMDVVPFIDQKTYRTYVSARFMAESLGYTVGWDNVSKVVLINDFKKLFANADNDFSILNKLISSDLDMEKTYHSTGNFNADFKTFTGGTAVPFSMSGSVDGLQYKTDAEMSMDFTVNSEAFISQLPEDQRAAAKASMEMLKNISIKMKINGEAGTMYMNAPLFKTLDPSIDENTWLKMDIFKAYDDMGFDIRGMMNLKSSKATVGGYLESFVSAGMPMDSKTYENTKAVYSFMNYLVGDAAFTKQVSGNAATYTLKIDAVDIAAALAKTALTAGLTLSTQDISDIKSSLDSIDFSSDIMVKTSNDKMSSYSVSGNGNYQGATMNFKMAGTQMSADMSLDFSMESIMQMNMKVTSLLKETPQVVDLKLPQGARILDYNSLINGATSSGVVVKPI